MTNVQITEDLTQNSEKQFIKDYNIAFANGDTDQIVSMMSEDARWTMIGQTPYKGSAAIREALDNAGLENANELVIDNIISEGGRCVANGTMRFENSAVAFCDVYIFADSEELRIKELISYAVDIK